MDPETTARVQEIREVLKERRKGACEYPPCAQYVPKYPDDYGYGSCTQCGWSEPEHVIDQLRDLLDASQARAVALAQERDAHDVDIKGEAALIRELRATLAQVTAERDEWMASSAGYGSDAVEWKVNAEVAEEKVRALEAALKEKP